MAPTFPSPPVIFTFSFPSHFLFSLSFFYSLFFLSLLFSFTTHFPFFLKTETTFSIRSIAQASIFNHSNLKLSLSLSLSLSRCDSDTCNTVDSPFSRRIATTTTSILISSSCSSRLNR